MPRNLHNMFNVPNKCNYRHFRFIDWVECVLRLPSRFILRHDGAFSSHWELYCREVFSCIGFCMLVLFGGYVRFHHGSGRYLQFLLERFLCCNFWVDEVHGVHRGIVLRLDGTLCSNWNLRGW